jgi:hypothetical protein
LRPLSIGNRIICCWLPLALRIYFKYLETWKIILNLDFDYFKLLNKLKLNIPW